MTFGLLKLNFSSRLFLGLMVAAICLPPVVLAETLIFGRGGDSVGLDPARVTDGESFNVTDHIFENLVTFVPGTTDVTAGVASNWEISANGLTYTFTLRDGIKFHDGTPLNAEAVVFSFERQLNEKHPAYAFGAPYIYFKALGLDTLIKSVAAAAPNKVVFTLTKPEAPFLSSLGMQAFAIVSPTAVNKYKEDFARNPVGSGPYVFKTWVKNQKVVLEANADYWGEKAKIQKLVFRSIPDNNTRLMEMMGQKIHVMDNPAPDDIKTLKEKMGKSIQFAQRPGLNVAYLALNNKKKPFDNVLVRQAIHYAINKKAIIASVYAGNAEPAKNPMPPTLWGYNDDVKTYDYNPVKAKELLKQAGYRDGFKVTLWAMPIPRPYMLDPRKVAEAIQGDLAAVGIKAQIVSYEWGTYLDKTQKGEHDMALMGWTGDIGDPDNFLYVLLDKDNAKVPAQNISFYENDKLHTILMEAKKTTDQKKRITLYKQAQAIIAIDSPMIPLAHSLDIVPMLTTVKHFVIDPTGRRQFSRVTLE